MKKFISIICVIAILLSSCYLFFYFYAQWQNNKILQNAADSLIDNVDNEEQMKEEYRKKYPDVNFPEDLLLKYYPVYAENQDLRGWISIPELGIDYPIMQSSDNNYYLRRNIKKEYSVWGIPFFDCSCRINPNSRNLIIYGHNAAKIKNKMFTPLNAYLTSDGFREAPVIKCDTIFEEAYWKVYAVFITNAKAKDDNGFCFNYMIPDFSTKSEFNEFISHINERAVYITGVGINDTDDILTLSTCNYSFKNARMIIVCRKVRPGESLTVDTNSVWKNPNPHYPQAWYDKRGKQNPYI